MNRRDLLKHWGCGFGMLALRAMLAEQASAKTDPLAPKAPHYRPRARRVIFLWMQGGPSQVDLFDPKPLLTKHDGKAIPYALPSNRTMPGVAYSKLMGPISGVPACGPVRPTYLGPVAAPEPSCGRPVRAASHAGR